jgi:hypothetical protein
MTAFSGRAITSSDAITWESFGYARSAAAANLAADAAARNGEPQSGKQVPA